MNFHNGNRQGVVFLFLMLCCFSSKSQTFNPSFLLQMQKEYTTSFYAKKQAAELSASLFGYEKTSANDAETSYKLISVESSIPRYFLTHNSGGATLIKTSDVYTGGSAGYHLSGDETILGIWDAGKVRSEHQEFGSRVTQIDQATSNHNHATHVAGTMVASGVNTSAKGMSFQASLWASDWDNDTGEMASAASQGLEVSQHSYGYLTGWHFGSWSGQSAWHWFGDQDVSTSEDFYFGHYGETAQEWDMLTYNAPDYLISASAGNDRGQGPNAGTSHFFFNGTNWASSTATREKDGGSDGYDCISHRAVSKNVITVGAVDGSGNMTSFSSWGPTDDGRIKPDIVAKGSNVTSTGANSNTHYFSTGGTSMSGPMVSGSVGVIMEHQQNLHGDQKLSSAMKKGLIIHTADDLIDGVAGPNYSHGWGLMNTRKAIETMTKNATSGLGALMMEGSLFPNDTIQFTIEATGGEPLRASLTWTDMPGSIQAPALNPTSTSLVNDLDMRLINVDNVVFLPYVLNPAMPTTAATTGDNFRDNVEMIHIGVTTAGALYTLKIYHKNSLLHDQKFALIISGANLNDCPVLAKAPGNAIIQNSRFNASCTLSGGQFLAPTDLTCPLGSTIQYRVNDGLWSSSIPAYNQSGPIQYIATRCACNLHPDYTSPESTPISTRPRVVANASDSGTGSLRHAILCANEFDTIYFDHQLVDSVTIIPTLDIDKSLTIIGNTSTDKSNITFDFNSVGLASALRLSGTGKQLILSNLIFHAVNNSLHNPIFHIESGNRIHIKDGVQLED